MGQSPLRPCAGQCGTMTRGGRCAACSRKSEQRRGSAHSRGYDTKRWAPARAAFLLEYPICGMRPGGQKPVMSQCHEDGIITAAAQVDHVVPHKGDAVLFWDAYGNWQPLCASCGARKSAAGL